LIVEKVPAEANVFDIIAQIPFGPIASIARMDDSSCRVVFETPEAAENLWNCKEGAMEIWFKEQDDIKMATCPLARLRTKRAFCRIIPSTTRQISITFEESSPIMCAHMLFTAMRIGKRDIVWDKIDKIPLLIRQVSEYS
jgi:hypothetical protein